MTKKTDKKKVAHLTPNTTTIYHCWKKREVFLYKSPRIKPAPICPHCNIPHPGVSFHMNPAYVHSKHFVEDMTKFHATVKKWGIPPRLL